MNCEHRTRPFTLLLVLLLGRPTQRPPAASKIRGFLPFFFPFIISGLCYFHRHGGDGLGSHSQVGERLQHVALNNVWGENHFAFAPPAQRFCFLEHLLGVLKPLIRVSFFKSRM